MMRWYSTAIELLAKLFELIYWKILFIEAVKFIFSCDDKLILKLMFRRVIESPLV